jgi:hypothetical protein
VYGRDASSHANPFGFVATTGPGRIGTNPTTSSSSTDDETTTATTHHPILTHDTLIGMLRMSPPVHSDVAPRQQ